MLLNRLTIVSFRVRFTSPFKLIMSKQQTLARFFSNDRTAASPKRKRSPSGPQIKSVLEDEATPISPPSTKADAQTESANALTKKVKLETAEIGKLGKIEKVEVQESEKVEKSEQPDHSKQTIEKSSSNDIIKYKTLSDVFEILEQTSSRLEMISIISKFFIKILQTNPDKLTTIVYLFINRLGPDYEPDLELGLGETLLLKAIGECYGRSIAKVKEDYHQFGDLGVVALKSRINQPAMFKPKPLTIDLVFEKLNEISKSNGTNSQNRKISIIIKLLTACEGVEAKFLIRSLEGKLRIGLAEKTILVGLAKAFLTFENHDVDKTNQVEEMIRDAFCQVPNYEIIITNALKHGIFNILDYCKLTPGIPLKPMLAKPTKSISEILDRFKDEEFTCEYKYDGERAQIHYMSDGEIKIYSRNSEDMSQRYPDITQIVSSFTGLNSNAKSFILDCEAVAWDRETEKILPFQVLSTRKRKDVDESQIKVNICLFVFDILCLNDESLISKTLKERREIMTRELTPIQGKFQFVTSLDSNNLDDLQKFLDQSIKDSCEGLMVKSLIAESQYEPSKRSRNWLKLKKDYLDGMGDSLDLVVIGAYIGKGKRTGSYGGFLLASYNQNTGEYETTCKIGTGFSEEDLKKLYETLKPTEMDEPKSYFIYDKNNSNAIPDVWFEPTLLFEVLTADLSLSPIYKAGSETLGKGVSLRFPRFLRIRDDKGVEDGTTSDEIIEFYQRQANVN